MKTTATSGKIDSTRRSVQMKNAPVLCYEATMSLGACQYLPERAKIHDTRGIKKYKGTAASVRSRRRDDFAFILEWGEGGGKGLLLFPYSSRASGSLKLLEERVGDASWGWWILLSSFMIICYCAASADRWVFLRPTDRSFIFLLSLSLILSMYIRIGGKFKWRVG